MRQVNVTVLAMTMAAAVGWAPGCSSSSDNSPFPSKSSPDETPDADSDAGVTPAAETCPPGTFTKNDPSTTVLACEPCASGTFSASTNAASCTPWTVCGSGETEQTPGSSTTDRACFIALWAHQFGTSDYDIAYSVSVDASGNVYVVGFTYGALPGQTNTGDNDAYVRKYDGSGKELWTRQFGTSTSDGASSVSVDASGNVYVVGGTYGSLPGQTNAGDYDAFLRKYDDDGKELWTQQFGTSAFDKANSVRVDASGSVYVAGETRGTLLGQTSAGDLDAFVRKYDGDGKELWTQQFGTSGSDSAFSVSVDASGSVYLTGEVETALPGQTSAGGDDAFVRKYDGAGKELWTQQFGTSGSDSAASVSVDASGNVYLVGQVKNALPGQTSSGGFDAYVRKYDDAGKELWTHQFGTKQSTGATSVGVDGSGNVYLVGATYEALPGQTSAGGADAYARKYDGSGKELWTHQFGTSEFDLAVSVSVDGSGNVYLAGVAGGALPGQTNLGINDAFVLRMNP